MHSKVERIHHGFVHLAKVAMLVATTSFGAAHADTYTVIHKFNKVEDGNPTASSALVVGPDGALYGATSVALYRVGTDGSYMDIYHLPSASTTVFVSALLPASDGMLYGLAAAPGTCGYVFSTDTAGHLALVHTFAVDGSEGCPAGNNLVEASDGSLYGLNANAGPNGMGTAYRLDKAGALHVT